MLQNNLYNISDFTILFKAISLLRTEYGGATVSLKLCAYTGASCLYSDTGASISFPAVMLCLQSNLHNVNAHGSSTL